jgi:hypothetical protein
MAKIKGHCLCGAVAYEVSGDPEMTFNCHCGRCRRWTGSAFATLMAVQGGHVNRSFCKICGSSLFGFQWPDGPGTVVPMGTIEGDPGVRPTMHINVEFKAPWHEITDDVRQIPGFPGG